MDGNWRDGFNDFSWSAYPSYGHETAMRNTSWRGSANHYQSNYTSFSRFDGRATDYHPYAQASTSSGFAPLGPPHRYFTHAPIPGFATDVHNYLPLDAQRPSSRPIKEDFTNFSSESEPLTLHFEVASRKIDISWKPPWGYRNMFYYAIEVLNNSTAKRAKYEKKWNQTMCELKVMPGTEYTITVECRTIRDDKVIATGNGTVTARLSHNEYLQLYRKCEVFARNDMHPFEVLYRCKPKCYWEDIHLYRSGIMQKYAKDFNGQPANWINGVLSGLFFSARLDKDGYLPNTSPFGDTRMIIQAYTLLNPVTHNFYFADFYCNYMTHYITIVICRKESETDLYSKQHLIRINPEDNPFLKVCRAVYPNSIPTYFVNRNIWVEIYYTEDIPLSWGRNLGAGTSKIGGLPNNKYCPKCNLYPSKDPGADKENGEKENEDDYYDDVQEVGRSDELLKSTFKVLINQDKSNIDDWEDIIEIICNSVDSVCNSEAEEKKDPIALSDESVIEVLKRMHDELGSTENSGVKKAAEELTHFVDDFTKTRDAMWKKILSIPILKH
ncbi:hypothetical protein WR25_06995 [Diploscapter pachys]|uniref:Phytanoyl-CoA hydroxylase-interacting protein-like C-terminal domain-containing protein n=1 Tax=Diploscapter pachys TaxID=2018661 RepID=A0A2A2LXE8_9BILA|nr:hypothetical protein WR25_06995 [Diploscapter pachys]